MMKFLVDRPVGVILSYVALALLGMMAYLYLPVSLMPDIDVPVITVHVDQPNSSAIDIEQHVVNPLRNRLRQISGLEDMNSTTREGSAEIRLIFAHGTNIHLSFIEVNEQVDLSMSTLPRDVTRPQVIKSGSADIPAFFCNIQSATAEDPEAFSRLCELTEKVIKKRIEQLPEVAMADITGLNSTRILITPDENKLRALHISSAGIEQLLTENNLQLGNIEVKDGQYQYVLRFGNNLYSSDDVANIPINVSGRLLHLRDLVNVRVQQAPPRGGFYAGQQMAINLAVIKQPGARMADLKENFRLLLDAMHRDYPDIRFDIVQDQSTLLDFAISNLQQDLLLGAILAIIFVLLFIKNIRLALLIGLVVPISLVLCQLIFYVFHISLNIVSLSGLILGLGMIIDNSIVVIDNITQYTDAGVPIGNACVLGTTEVARPLFTSFLTNCSIFLPLIFLSGIAGALFYEQAASMAAGIFISMVVSLTLLPVLYKLIRSKKDVRVKVVATQRNGMLDKFYESGLHLVMRSPRILLAGSILLIIAAFITFNRMPGERIPNLAPHNIEVKIDWNEPISYEVNQQRVDDLMTRFNGNTMLYNCWIGKQQYMTNRHYTMDATQALIYVETRNSKELDLLQRQITSWVRQQYPAADIRLQPAATPLEQLFGQHLPILTLRLQHPNKERMPVISVVDSNIQKINQMLPGLGLPAPAIERKLLIHLNYDLLMLYGVQPPALINVLAGKLKPRQIGEVQGVTGSIPMVIGVGTQFSPDQMLSDLFVNNKDNNPVPVSSLITITGESDYKYLTGDMHGLYYPVDMDTKKPAKIIETLTPILSSINAELKGDYFYTRQLIHELCFILFISVLLLYFILAAQFESLLQPLIILAELPLDVACAVLLLYFTGNSINLMSMIGLIVMCGIIINDSILKIDAINQLIKTGIDLDMAIHTAGKKRLHSIVMITLTTTGTLLPTLFMHDPGSMLQQPLVIALIGGMVPGMFISLFVIPMLYRFVYRERRYSATSPEKIVLSDEMASF